MGNQRLDLKDRDLLLLNHLCEFGYLKFHHIQNRVLRCHKKLAFRRLKELRDYNLIDLMWKNNRRIGPANYTPLIQNLIGTLDLAVLERALLTKSVSQAQTKYGPHEDAVRSVALSIYELFPLASLDLEHHLSIQNGRHSFSKSDDSDALPDIVARLPSGTNIAFEIELTEKTRVRYLKKFRRLNDSDFSALIYVSKDPVISRTVLDCFRVVTADLTKSGLCRLPRLHVCALEQGLSSELLRTVLSHVLDPSTAGSILKPEDKSDGHWTFSKGAEIKPNE